MPLTSKIGRLLLQETYPYTIKGTAKTSDYTLIENDLAIGFATTANDITLTVPDANTIAIYPRSWFVKKMTADINKLIYNIIKSC